MHSCLHISVSHNYFCIYCSISIVCSKSSAAAEVSKSTSAFFLTMWGLWSWDSKLSEDGVEVDMSCCSDSLISLSTGAWGNVLSATRSCCFGATVGPFRNEEDVEDFFSVMEYATRIGSASTTPGYEEITRRRDENTVAPKRSMITPFICKKIWV